MKDKFILDACCGSRMMWFNKQHPNTLYIDNRMEEYLEKQGHQNQIIIKPDMIMDFRNLEFPDKSFKLVVCDPPHLTKLGENRIYRRLFGKLDENNWREDLKKGFSEMWRVLDDYGVFLLKWNDYEIGFGELKKLFPVKPLFYNRKSGSANSKTSWFCFMKIPDALAGEELTK